MPAVGLDLVLLVNRNGVESPPRDGVHVPKLQSQKRGVVRITAARTPRALGPRGLPNSRGTELNAVHRNVAPDISPLDALDVGGCRKAGKAHIDQVAKSEIEVPRLELDRNGQRLAGRNSAGLVVSDLGGREQYTTV